MKKALSLVLALLLALTLTAPAFAASITINANMPETGATSGQTYKAYKVFDASISGNNVSYTIDTNSPFYAAVSASNLFTLVQINNSNVYNVSAKNDATGAQIAEILTVPETATVAGQATSVNGTAKIEGLTPGYYLVTSSLGTKVIVDTLGDVIVKTKNDYPSLTKTVNKATVDLGSDVTYTIDVAVPASAVGEIVVHDTMDGVTFKQMNTDATTAGVTVNETPCEGHSVCFTIPANLVAGNLGKTVTIVYTATVTAEVGKNEAYLTYHEFTSKPVETEVKNFEIAVYKFTGAGEAKTGLAGAGFVLKNAAGKYYKLVNGVVSWVDSETEATEYTTEADTYTITFTGLANGTYTLVEKTVPAGYNKANDVEVTIENADKTGETQIDVENKTGSELPSTGGVGTIIFYVVGGLLMVCALALLVTRRKMRVSD